MSVAITSRLRHHDEVTDEETARDPRAGSRLGRLHLVRIISDEQLAAGLRLAALIHRYHVVTSLPRPFPRAPDLTVSPGRSLLLDDDSYVRAIVADYDAAVSAIGGQADRRDLVISVVYRDDGPIALDAQAIWMLRRGLSRLADHFGLS